MAIMALKTVKPKHFWDLDEARGQIWGHDWGWLSESSHQKFKIVWEKFQQMTIAGNLHTYIWQNLKH